MLSDTAYTLNEGRASSKSVLCLRASTLPICFGLELTPYDRGVGEQVSFPNDQNGQMGVESYHGKP